MQNSELIIWLQKETMHVFNKQVLEMPLSKRA